MKEKNNSKHLLISGLKDVYLESLELLLNHDLFPFSLMEFNCIQKSPLINNNLLYIKYVLINKFYI